MAYIKKKSERKFKITVCNGYKVNGQKRNASRKSSSMVSRKATRPTLISTPKIGSNGRNRSLRLPLTQGTNAIWILSTR